MSGPVLDPREREHLERWYRSLSGRQVKQLHAAIGHSTTNGRAPRVGTFLLWTAVVLGVVLAVLLGLAGASRYTVLPFLPVVGLAWIGSLLRDGLDPGYVLTDELLISLWEADQRLSAPDR